MAIILKSEGRPKAPDTLRRPQRGAIHVYETLREDILWLRIAPGTPLDEVALATRFDISRTPIREALMLLAGDSLVMFLPNRSSIVPPLSLHNQGEYMDVYLLLSRAAVRGAILNLQSGDEKILQARLADLLAQLDTSAGEPALRAELALRHLLGDLARNSFQNQFYRQILDMGIRTKILHFFPNTDPADLAEIKSRWLLLIESVAQRDALRADGIITRMLLAENEIIMRSLLPKFGHHLALPPI